MAATHRSRLSATLFVLVLVACAGPGAGESAPADSGGRPSQEAPPAETVPATPDPATGEVPAEIMSAILADATDRSGVPGDALEVVRAEQVTWPDGSLGCPEPGMMYTQALVDGYHVVIDADESELDYRVTAEGGFGLCEADGPPAGG